MAQAGFTPISIYYSTTAAAVPSAGNLTSGELAINITDGKLYFKNASNLVTLLASASGASGDVVGPASATDNAIVRFDGTTGKLVQNSVVTIADTTGDISGVGQLNATTANLTNIEVTNIKAKDGTAAATIADSTGLITVSTELRVDNLSLDGNTISSTDSNGNIVLAPNGTGDVQVNADTLQVGDSNANATVTTNGTGNLILNTNNGTNAGSFTLANGADGNMTLAPNGNGSVVITNAGTSNALLITQTGTGNALVVEDSANPDATPFVVDATGNIISGATTVINVASELDGSQNPVGFEKIGTGYIAAGAFVNFANSTTNARPSFLVLGRSNGAPASSFTAVEDSDELGVVSFQGADGTALIRAASIKGVVDGTPGTNDMPGRLVFSTTADGASSPTERMRIDSAGRVGIGTSSLTGFLLRGTGNLTGSVSSRAVDWSPAIQSDVTSTAYVFSSVPSVQDASFTLSTLGHFRAVQGTKGASATVTSQVGFYAESSLTGATNNYGFYSAIPSGTGRYNFYANGTADNYFGGPTTISVSSSSDALRITQVGTGNALVVEDSANPDATPFVVASDGSVIQGYNSIQLSNDLQEIHSAGGSNFGVGIFNWQNTISYGPTVNLIKSQSGTIGTKGAVSAGAFSGITFRFDDGTSFIRAAEILAVVDGTPGANDMPGRLMFSTTADGTIGPTERMRITNAGIVSIGSTSPGVTRLQVDGNATGGTTAYGLLQQATAQSDVTTAYRGYAAFNRTAAAAFTVGEVTSFYAAQSTFGATSAVTNQYGFLAQNSLTGATNNYGFFSNIASGTGRWNFYANGTADNAFAGNTRFGAATAPTVAVDVTGAILATTTIRSSGATSGIGYATGAGSTATQGAGSGKATAVTLNNVCGQITMNNAALNGDTTVSFTLTNSAIAATDLLVLNHVSGGTAGSYTLNAQAAAGSATINVRNVTTGSLSEAIVIGFAVIKAVTA